MWNRDTDAKIIWSYNLHERSLRAINYPHLKWILNLTSPSTGTHTSSTDEMFRKQFPLYPGYCGLWHCLDAGRAEVILGSLLTLTLTSSTDKCLLWDFDWHKLWRGDLWSSNSHDIYWTTPRSHIWSRIPPQAASRCHVCLRRRYLWADDTLSEILGDTVTSAQHHSRASNEGSWRFPLWPLYLCPNFKYTYSGLTITIVS